MQLCKFVVHATETRASLFFFYFKKILLLLNIISCNNNNNRANYGMFIIICLVFFLYSLLKLTPIKENTNKYLKRRMNFLLKKANSKNWHKIVIKSWLKRKRCAQFNEAVKTNEMKRCVYENALILNKKKP